MLDKFFKSVAPYYGSKVIDIRQIQEQRQTHDKYAQLLINNCKQATQYFEIEVKRLHESSFSLAMFETLQKHHIDRAKEYILYMATKVLPLLDVDLKAINQILDIPENSYDANLRSELIKYQPHMAAYMSLCEAMVYIALPLVMEIEPNFQISESFARQTEEFLQTKYVNDEQFHKYKHQLVMMDLFSKGFAAIQAYAEYEEIVSKFENSVFGDVASKLTLSHGFIRFLNYLRGSAVRLKHSNELHYTDKSIDEGIRRFEETNQPLIISMQNKEQVQKIIHTDLVRMIGHYNGSGIPAKLLCDKILRPLIARIEDPDWKAYLQLCVYDLSLLKGVEEMLGTKGDYYKNSVVSSADEALDFFQSIQQDFKDGNFHLPGGKDLALHFPSAVVGVCSKIITIFKMDLNTRYKPSNEEQLNILNKVVLGYEILIAATELFAAKKHNYYVQSYMTTMVDPKSKRLISVPEPETLNIKYVQKKANKSKKTIIHSSLFIGLSSELSIVKARIKEIEKAILEKKDADEKERIVLEKKTEAYEIYLKDFINTLDKEYADEQAAAEKVMAEKKFQKKHLKNNSHTMPKAPTSASDEKLPAEPIVKDSKAEVEEDTMTRNYYAAVKLILSEDSRFEGYQELLTLQRDAENTGDIRYVVLANIAIADYFAMLGSKKLIAKNFKEATIAFQQAIEKIVEAERTYNKWILTHSASIHSSANEIYQAIIIDKVDLLGRIEAAQGSHKRFLERLEAERARVRNEMGDKWFQNRGTVSNEAKFYNAMVEANAYLLEIPIDKLSQSRPLNPLPAMILKPGVYEYIDGSPKPHIPPLRQKERTVISRYSTLMINRKGEPVRDSERRSLDDSALLTSTWNNLSSDDRVAVDAKVQGSKYFDAIIHTEMERGRSLEILSKNEFKYTIIS